jgi:lipopolysaccharide biosynthesis glycosyltransferase
MKVFIGYDEKEKIAAEVCEYRLKQFNSNLEIVFLKQEELRKQRVYYRENDSLSSTEFAFTRFLVPALCEYKGWALYIDCDFLFLEDASNLLKQTDDKYAVMVVKHNYQPNTSYKMDNQKQFLYPRKNWSSLILWNCAHPLNRELTIDLVNSSSAQFLHRFSWLTDDVIGEISHEWNWLVGWYKEPKDGAPKALHFTEGGPWFKGYEKCEYYELWNEALNDFSKRTQTKF